MDTARAEKEFGLRGEGHTRKRSSDGTLKEHCGPPRTCTPSGSSPPSSALPPDVWAKAVSFLPYTDMIQCSVLSEMFLRSVAPKIEHIEVEHSRELRVVPARRFPNVKKMRISCLYTHTPPGRDPPPADENHPDPWLDRNAVEMIVPFVSCFHSLGYVEICGNYDKQRSVYLRHRVYNDFEDNDRKLLREDGAELMRMLIYSFCGAFRSGLIPQNLEVEGILYAEDYDRRICWSPTEEDITNGSVECPTCLEAAS